MGQVLHGGAITTAAVRRAIQHSQESLSDRLRMVVAARRVVIGGPVAAEPKVRFSQALQQAARLTQPVSPCSPSSARNCATIALSSALRAASPTSG